MRCLSCNVLLKPHEAVRKYKVTDKFEYIDLCDSCLSTTDDNLVRYLDIPPEVEEYEDGLDLPTP